MRQTGCGANEAERESEAQHGLFLKVRRISDLVITNVILISALAQPRCVSVYRSDADTRILILEPVHFGRRCTA